MVWDFFSRFVLFARDNSVVKKIAWLTVFGMLLSIASLLVTMSVMTALNASQRDRTLAVEPHLIIELQDVTDVNRAAVHPVAVAIQNLHPQSSELFAKQDVILRTLDGRFHGAIARGLPETSIGQLLERVDKSNGFSVTSAGSSSSDFHLDAGEVVLGHDLAKSLGVFEGDTLLVVAPEGLLLPPSEAPKFERVYIKRIISSYVTEVDGQSLFYRHGGALRSLIDSGSRKIGYEVRLIDADDADRAKQELQGFAGVDIQTWKERNSALFYCLFLEKTMIGVFLGLASLVAALSLLSVISLVISQKRKEIGLLLALGYSREGVIKLFTQIGTALAACGIGVGLVVGSGISLLLEYFPLNILPPVYVDSQIPAKLQLPFLLWVSVIGAIFAILGSWLTVKLSVAKHPSQLLR